MLLDHIYTNYLNSYNTCEMIKYDISDDFPICTRCLVIPVTKFEFLCLFLKVLKK